MGPTDPTGSRLLPKTDVTGERGNLQMVGYRPHWLCMYYLTSIEFLKVKIKCIVIFKRLPIFLGGGELGNSRVREHFPSCLPRAMVDAPYLLVHT